MDRLIRIRWSNHKGSLLSSFDTLLAKESMVDVTLACEGQLLRAHKLVLCACSTYFEEILSVDASKHPIIFMRDTPYSELKALIQYMYRGEVNIEERQLKSLISLAQALKIRGLAQLEPKSSNSAKPDASPVPDPETDHEPITTEPETINQEEGKVEENPIISSGVAAAAAAATVDLLPTAPANKSSSVKPVTATASPDRKRKASHSPPREKRNPLPTEPGLHYHRINSGIRNALSTGHGLYYHLVRDSESGSESKDDFDDEENGDEMEDYFDPVDSISDFQDEDEEGQDSPMHSHLSTGELDSDNENKDEEGIAEDAENSDEERMPYSPTMGLDTLDEMVGPDRLGFLREKKIVSNRKGRKTVKPEFQCPNPGCGRYYSQKSSLKRHLDFECYKEPQFSCPHCGLKSKLRGNAEIHERKCKSRIQGPASRAGR